MDRSRALTIWDTADDPPGDGSTVYLWQGTGSGSAVRSLLEYVETHATRLRRTYLAWIHDLGVAPVSSRGRSLRLVDALAQADGPSAWWMSTLVEQSLMYKSPGIVDALRLLAIEEIVRAEQPAMLRLVGGSDAVHQSLRDLCAELGIGYERSGESRDEHRSLKRRAYRAMPHWLRALVVLGRNLFGQWPLRRAPRAEDGFDGSRTVCFISYFFHLDGAACRDGTFRSNYWHGLPNMLQSAGYRVNWIEHYVPSRDVPTTSVALEWVARFNARRDQEGFHAFVDAHLTWRIVWRAVVGWMRCATMARRIESRVRTAFRPARSRVSLWPVLRDEWLESTRGPSALLNMLHVELFDEALRRLPRQPVGLYVCENQGWERAMIHAWRKHGHGRLIAFAHSTIRFWDLRYFTDARTIDDRGPNAMPRPDVLALNGTAALDAYRDAAYPTDSVAECESLRYGYLHHLAVRARHRRKENEPLRVLVLGDYSGPETSKMLDLLSRTMSLLPAGTIFTLKPHPNHAVDAASYPSLRLRVVHDGLAKTLREHDVAYSSSATSAAVDAYLAGLPLVVMKDDAQLEFSPLRRSHGVSFARTPQDLAEGLLADLTADDEDRANGFFFLDPALPRWKRLLNVDGGQQS